jgi:hypothetical protein
MVPDDQRYLDIIQVHEPFEHNEGWKSWRARPRAGRQGQWICRLGLGGRLRRTDGAYQLLANLVSRGKLAAATR